MQGYLFFGYVGPIMGSILITSAWSLIGVICVFIYLHRERLRKYKLFYFLTSFLHKPIKKIALKKIKNNERKK